MSGIRPIEYNVVVKPEKVEEKTKGGIYIPDETKDRDQFGQHRGVLVGVSPMAFDFEDWPEGEPKPEVGQEVIFVKYAGTLVKGRDGEDYRVMKDKDVIAVMEASDV